MRLAVLDKTAMNFHAKEKSSRKAIEKSSMKYSVARSPIDCTNLVTHFLSVAKLRVDISMWDTTRSVPYHKFSHTQFKYGTSQRLSLITRIREKLSWSVETVAYRD